MQERIGKFQVLKTLGQGTMGEVFLAQDEALGRQVALKVIGAGNAFGGESRARFEREARALAALNHPHVVTLYEFGVEGDCPFLAMEYLEGEDLAALIASKALPKTDLLEVLAQVCEGLGQAHAQGLVHRDVKPANVRVVTRAGRPQAKLMDFGIASEAASSLTQKGAWMGTVSYMAPEYLESGHATPSSDLFAVGIMLFEILSGGRRPFPGDSAPSILGAILGKRPEPLKAEDLQDVPRGMAAVLDKALAKDPAERFASAEALAQAIRAVLSAPARPPSEPVRLLDVGGGPKPYLLSVRVALRQAPPGAIVRIHAGAYKEPLHVEKEVTLRAAGEGVHLNGGITVLGGVALTLQGLALGNPAGAGLVLNPGASLEAEDCAFQAAAAGLELGPESRASLQRCRFEGNGFAGLLALESSQASLQDCRFAGNQDAGIHACGGASLQLAGCAVEGNPGIGLSAVDGANLELDRCEVTANGEPGLLLHRGAGARLRGCGVMSGRSTGIQCQGGARVELEACRVAGNAGGAFRTLDGGPEPVLGPDTAILP